MSHFNVVEHISLSISVVIVFSLVACQSASKVAHPPYQSSIYQQRSQSQVNTDYSQQELDLRNQLVSAKQLCNEYTQKVQQGFQASSNSSYFQAPNAGLVGMQSFQCGLANQLESDLMQLQLQRQFGQ